MKNGVPKSKSSHINPEYTEALEGLQNISGSWNEFINSENMPENEMKIQSAIWELVTTEVDYIFAIQTVTDVSRFKYLMIYGKTVLLIF
jgi:pleckstrin domain-containing family G protein 5